MDVEFSELCRICLSKADNMKYLFDSSKEICDLIFMLSSIIHYQINILEGLPSYLCYNCEEKLKISYEFQQLSQKSNNMISQYIDSPFIVLDQKDHLVSFTEIASSNVFKDENNDTVEEISVLYENNNYNEINKVEYISKKERKPSKLKLSQHDRSEVMNVIKETKLKFYEAKECLLCTFTGMNNRTLSLHMTKNHHDLKDKWCQQCNKIVENISQHVETVHKDDLKCPFCGKKCRISSHLVRHLMHHCVDEQFICQTCNKCFTTNKNLKYHIKIHHILCEICSETFSDTQSLLLHAKIHDELKCNLCDKHYSKGNFDKHICFGKEENGTLKSTVQLDTFCVECNEEVDNLDRHIKIHDKDYMKALCTYCGKQFKNQSYLTIHLRRHTKELPYKCKYCEVATITKAHLQEHERTHTGEKPYVCKFCGKAFIQRSILTTHLKIHTGRTEQCHLCPKKFCRPSELRTHMRKHTGEKPYACKYCNRSFIQRSHLTEHIKTHTDDRPFICPICNKAFKQSSTLKGHLNIHEGKNIFKCGICSYTCRKNYTLTLHIREHQSTIKQNNNYKCEICDETFTTEDILSSHQNSRHKNCL